MKILVLLFYYDRPEIVKNALDSIAKQTYDNFEVAFIDDGSKHNGEEVVREMFGEDEILDKFHFIRIEDTPEEKAKQGGSRLGLAANIAMTVRHPDVVLMLCDDDALMPGYLEYLSEYFQINPEVNHCYSKVKFFNPTKESYLEATSQPSYSHAGSTYAPLNNKTGAIKCEGLDASQVAWRKRCDVKFPYPHTRCHDSVVYKQLQDAGLCYPTGIVGQCKGAFADQLGNRWKDGKNEFIINNI